MPHLDSIKQGVWLTRQMWHSTSMPQIYSSVFTNLWHFFRPVPTTRNIVGCYALRPFAHPVAYCRLGVVEQSLQPVKLLSKQLPTFFFPVIAVVWIRLHSSSNFVGPRTRITPDLPPRVLWVVSFPWYTVGLNIVGSCCIRLHTTTANTDATIPNS